MKKLRIKFYENRKFFFMLSLAVILIGILFNVIFGTQLDIQFTGGAVIKYSYQGELNPEEFASFVSQQTGEASVTAQINENVKNAGGVSDQNNVTVSFGGMKALDLEKQKSLMDAIETKYPSQSFELISSSSVNPSMGRTFFIKCLVAVAIAAVLLIIYIAFRFRKIGGASAGLMAIVALVHDVAIVYFVFIIFRIPLNDSFIAVVLTILGYSVNDTIVIYDRVRENSRILKGKETLPTILNTSLNQVFSRSVYTSITTFVAITTVFVVGFLYNLPSITTFALPMMVGIIVGCYSSLCIAGPLFVMWQERKAGKAA